MKHFYISILYILCIPVLVFANENIDIETSEKDVKVGETFTITIYIKNIELDSQSTNIAIDGIDKFDVFSQSMTTSFQSINGRSENITQLSLDLRARESGEFSLGPVEIQGGENIRDNEKLNILVSSDLIQSPPNQLTPGENSARSENSNVGDELLDDIDPGIKGLRDVRFPIWGHIAFFIFFVASFYLLLSYVFKKDIQNQKDLIIPKTPENKNNEYIQYFESLSQEIGYLQSEDFFHQFNLGMRKIFSDITNTNIKTTTLSELSLNKTLLLRDEFSIFKKSYKHEYSGVEVSKQTQKKYIEDIVSLLK